MLKQNRFNCNKVRVSFIYYIPLWNAVFLRIKWTSHWFICMSSSHSKLGVIRFVYWLLYLELHSLSSCLFAAVLLVPLGTKCNGNDTLGNKHIGEQTVEHLLTWIALWEAKAIWKTKNIAVIIDTLDLWHQKKVPHATSDY